jgi:hypothetical protein
MASGTAIAAPIECLSTCLDKRRLIASNSGGFNTLFRRRNSTVHILSCIVRPGARRNGGADMPALVIVTISASQALHMLNVGYLGN